MRLFSFLPCTRHGAMAIERDDPETVSDEQLACSCVAACVLHGALQLVYADGSRVAVPEHVVARSPVLQSAVEASSSDSTEVSLLAPRELVHSWFQFVNKEHVPMCSQSTITVFRQLQAADFLADELALQKLCRMLGERLFPAVTHKRSLSAIRRCSKLPPPPYKVLSELPQDLALSVLRASTVSLHNCLLKLPRSMHHLAVLAHAPSITTQSTLQIVGQESAKPCNPDSGVPDTLVAALEASSSCPKLYKLRMSKLGLSAERTYALCSALASFSSLRSLTLQECMLSSLHLDTLLATPEVQTGLQRLALISCVLEDPQKVAFVLKAALPSLQALVSINFSKVNIEPLHFEEVYKVLPRLAKLRAVRLPPIRRDHEAVWIPNTLRSLTELTQLVISDYEMPQQVLHIFAHVLPSVSLIQHLELHVAAQALDSTMLSSNLFTSIGVLSALTRLHVVADLPKDAQRALATPLLNLSKLQNLELPGRRHSNNGPSLSRELVATMAALTTISLLTLKEIQITSNTSAAFSEALAALRSLSVLKLGFTVSASDSASRDENRVLQPQLNIPGPENHLHAGAPAAAGLSLQAPAFPTLPALPLLANLELNINIRSTQAALALASNLRNMTYLRRLYLSGGIQSDVIAVTLVQSITQMALLTRLRLNSNGIGDMSLSCLCAALQASALRKLRQLRLRTMGIRHEAADALAEALPALRSSLDGLQLSFVDPSFNARWCFSAITSGITPLTGLTCLHLTGAHLSAPATTALSSTLAKLTDLAKLSLNNCKPHSVGGWGELAGSIARLSKLCSLVLSSRALNDKGLAKLAGALSGLYNLRELDVSRSDVTEAGIVHLVNAFAPVVFLTRLQLSETRVEKPGPPVLQKPWIRF